jgi:hypothetical protein
MSEVIEGYAAIAAATGAAIKQSVSVRTAKRWAAEGRDLRLPVYIRPNRTTYMMRADLAAFAAAWLAPRTPMPRLPASIVKRTRTPAAVAA